MRTTKGERDSLRSALRGSDDEGIPGRAWWPDLLDDIDELEASLRITEEARGHWQERAITLETKCAFQAEMLKKSAVWVVYYQNLCHEDSQGFADAREWLSAYERGTKEDKNVRV